MIVTQHGLDLSHDPPSHCLLSQVPALCNGGSSFWQSSREAHIKNREYVCLFFRNPFSTILRTQIYDPSKLSHHLRVLPPNAIHVNLETKFLTHEILETYLTHSTSTYLLADLFIVCLPLVYKLQELESFCPIYHCVTII